MKKILLICLIILTSCTENEDANEINSEDLSIEILSKDLTTKEIKLIVSSTNASNIKGEWSYSSANNSLASFSNSKAYVTTLTIENILDVYLIKWTLPNINNKVEKDVEINLSENVSIDELITLGVTLEELVEYEYTLNDLLLSSISTTDLLKYYDSRELYENSVSIQTLLGSGKTIKSLLNEGFSIIELFEGKVFVNELLSNGVTEDELITAELMGTVSDFENNSYPWVKVDNKKWMAQNLRSTKFSDGSVITSAYSSTEDVTFLNNYGRYYEKSDIYNNPCPSGWRIPLSIDILNMMEHIGNAAGAKVKSTGTSNDGTGLWGKDNDEDEGTNTTGLNINPADHSGILNNEHYYMWTSSKTDNNEPLLFYVTYLSNSYSVFEYFGDRNYSATCRCIQD